MKYLVYILQSETNKYYIGHTSNLNQRLNQHNNGECKSTKFDQNWKIVYQELFKTRGKAMTREKQIKSYKSGEAFKKLLNS